MQEVKDANGEPEPLYDELELLQTDFNPTKGADKVGSDSTITSPSENRSLPKDNGNNADSKSDERICDAAPIYQGISEIPFPTSENPQYEDVSLLPLPSNIDSFQFEDKVTNKENNVGDEADTKEKKYATLKKMKNMALNTLKKDKTLKRDLTQKKSATLDKKENTLRRNTIKKTDDTTVSNAKRESDLGKDFADLEKVKIFHLFSRL
jgi:hypothetical protein